MALAGEKRMRTVQRVVGLARTERDPGLLVAVLQQRQFLLLLEQLRLVERRRRLVAHRLLLCWRGCAGAKIYECSE